MSNFFSNLTVRLKISMVVMFILLPLNLTIIIFNLNYLVILYVIIGCILNIFVLCIYKDIRFPLWYIILFSVGLALSSVLFIVPVVFPKLISLITCLVPSEFLVNLKIVIKWLICIQAAITPEGFILYSANPKNSTVADPDYHTPLPDNMGTADENYLRVIKESINRKCWRLKKDFIGVTNPLEKQGVVYMEQTSEWTSLQLKKVLILRELEQRGYDVVIQPESKKIVEKLLK